MFTALIKVPASNSCKECSYLDTDEHFCTVYKATIKGNKKCSTCQLSIHLYNDMRKELKELKEKQLTPE